MVGIRINGKDYPIQGRSPKDFYALNAEGHRISHHSISEWPDYKKGPDCIIQDGNVYEDYRSERS